MLCASGLQHKLNLKFYVHAPLICINYFVKHCLKYMAICVQLKHYNFNSFTL